MTVGMPGPLLPQAGDGMPQAGMRLVRGVVTFLRFLRTHGLPVGPDRCVLALRALGQVGVGSREEVRTALRLVCAVDPKQRERFDRLFDLFWDGGGAAAAEPACRLEAQAGPWSGGTLPAAPEAGSDAPAELPQTGALYSPHGVVRAPPQPAGEPDADRLLREAAARLARRLTYRPSRRARAGRRGERPDPRRTLRVAASRGGDAPRIVYRKRRIRRTRLVMLCDVSGSMQPHACLLLRFAQALTRTAGTLVETFIFSTRLERITAQLRRTTSRLPARPAEGPVRPGGSPSGDGVERLIASVPLWGAGTRIGQSLASFLRDFGHLLVPGESVVVVMSDGLDTGEVELMARSMARLRRNARRLLWINPLAADPRYEPLARGMRAALPYVDRLMAADDPASLAALERYL